MKREFVVSLVTICFVFVPPFPPSGWASSEYNTFSKSSIQSLSNEGPHLFYSEGPAYASDEIIVKFEPTTPLRARNQIVRQYDCSVIDTCLFADTQLVQIPKSTTPEHMACALQQHEAVQYAELNYYARILFVPNDTFYFLQWALDNDVTGGINMEQAWDIQTGDPNVIVAVLDTGVAFENFGTFRQAQDLAETRFVPGFDFVNDDAHPNDDHGHGTHVAGTIAQSTNNGLGVAGVAFNCSIMPVKVLSDIGTGSHFDIANGIFFATNNGAKVINMSLGGEGNSTTLRNAIRFAYSQGVTVVCAAGNEFLAGNPIAYPAAYDEYCIAVGATRYDETRAFYSNTGSYIDVVAPGGDTLVDQNNDGYVDGILQQTFNLDPTTFSFWFMQGTSVSTPHVSGAAALLISNGVTHPDKVRQAIESTAKDLGPPGWDEEYGWGLINVFAALSLKVTGDITGDHFINIGDLSLFAGQWLQTEPTNLAANLNDDDIVNFVDFAILAQKWSR